MRAAVDDQLCHALQVERTHAASGLVKFRYHAAGTVEHLEVGARASIQPDKIICSSAFEQARFKQACAFFEHKARALRLRSQCRNRHSDIQALATGIVAGGLYAVEAAIFKSVHTNHMVNAWIETNRGNQSASPQNQYSLATSITCSM